MIASLNERNVPHELTSNLVPRNGRYQAEAPRMKYVARIGSRFFCAESPDGLVGRIEQTFKQDQSFYVRCLEEASS